MASRSELEAIAHDHDYLGASHERNARRTLWVVALTATMMVGEIVAGYVTGSMALLADGFHMATHAGALAVAALAYAFARRNVDNPRFTFGTGKVGDLAGFASALVLGLIALGIAVESAARLAGPIRVDFRDATVVAVLGLLVNVASALLLAGGGHGHHHHAHHGAGDHHRHDRPHHHHPHHGDNNMRAAYAHVLADALTSMLAILALLAGQYLGWVWLDPVTGIVGALVIGRWSLVLVKETAAVLLDVADPRLLAEVREAVEGGGGARVADLHVWRVGPTGHAGVVTVVTALGTDEVRAPLRPVQALRHLTVEVVDAPV